MPIQIAKELIGSILDIGGGGEGVIGRVYGQQVIAIDNRQDELDEAPNGFQKLLMDARNVDFPQESFDHVTFFYSLMYMDRDMQIKALQEAVRVLRTGGCLHIWDSDIESAFPNAFLVELNILLPQEQLNTCYGIMKEDAEQDSSLFVDLCCAQGLAVDKKSQQDTNFYLSFVKQA